MAIPEGCRCPEGYPIIRDYMDLRMWDSDGTPWVVIERSYPILAPKKYGHTGDCPLTDGWILESLDDN